VAFEGGDKSSSSSKAQGGNAAAGAAKPIVVDDDPTQFQVALLAIVAQMLPNADPAQAQGLEALKTMLLAKGSTTQGRSEPDKPKSPQQEHTELMRYHDQVQSKLRRLEKKQGDMDLLMEKKRMEYNTASQAATDNRVGIQDARAELVLIGQRREAQFPNGVLTMPPGVTHDAYDDMALEEPIDIKYAGQFQMGGGAVLQGLGSSASNGAPGAVVAPQPSRRDSLPASYIEQRWPLPGTNLLSASGYDRGGISLGVPGYARAQQLQQAKDFTAAAEGRASANGKGAGKLAARRYDPFSNEQVKAQNAKVVAVTQEKTLDFIAGLAAEDEQVQQAYDDAKAANEVQIAEQEAANIEGVQLVDNLRADAVDKAQVAIDESVAGAGRPPEAAEPPLEA
jgi:hypothetical protein